LGKQRKVTRSARAKQKGKSFYKNQRHWITAFAAMTVKDSSAGQAQTCFEFLLDEIVLSFINCYYHLSTAVLVVWVIYSRGF
jgi:hypothetical protein